MKTITLFRLAVFAVTAGFLATPLARAQISPVSISVQVAGGHQGDKSDIYKHNDEKQLLISLQSSRPIGSATVRYFLFVKDLKSRRTLMGSKGEQQVTLSFGAPTQVKSEPLTATYTEEHTTGSRRSRKTTPASGQKYTGYGVQVVVDGQVVAEQFSQAALKSQIDGAPATPAAAKPPPKRGKK